MIHNKKIGVVLVNYHTIDQILSITKCYLGFISIDKIVIVNNDTKDDEINVLKNIESNKVKVFFEKENLGYSKGNNIGIDYLHNQGFDYVIISNSDIEVEEKAVIRCVELLEITDHYGALAPRMINSDGSVSPYRSIPNIGFKCLLLNAFSFHYDKKHEKELVPDCYGIVEQPMLPGSFFVCSMSSLIKCNKFDPNIFLYREEEILAYRLNKAGYDVGIVRDVTFKHNHPHKKESVKNVLKQYKQAQSSERYFFKYYLNIGSLSNLLLQVIQIVVLLRILVRQWIYSKCIK